MDRNRRSVVAVRELSGRRARERQRGDPLANMTVQVGGGGGEGRSELVSVSHGLEHYSEVRGMARGSGRRL